ncbi:MAG: hypothetical protein IKC77_01310 [Lentisphaeria bacterium]|nr:hypothetical protein [Lentisphaeria bacterium]
MKKITLFITVLAFVFAAVAQNTYNVRDFGAKGDGKTDDTAAIRRACEAAMKALGKGSRSYKKFKAAHDQRTVYFPQGTYIVKGTMNISDVSLKSDGARIIQKDRNAITFNYTTFWAVNISGFSFSGGKQHIVLTNDNIDKSLIFIDHCRFFHSSGTAVETLKGAQSTLFTLSNCEFIRCMSAVENRCDWAVLRDFWLMTPERMFDRAAIINRQGYMFVNNMLGVPLCNGADQRWIDNYGSLHCIACRFGAEGGGYTAIYNFRKYDIHGIGSQVIVESSQISTNTSPQRNAVVYCVEVPNQITVKDNTLNGAVAIKVAPEIDLENYFFAEKRMVNFRVKGNITTELDEPMMPALLENPVIKPVPMPAGWLDDKAVAKRIAEAKITPRKGSCELNVFTAPGVDFVVEKNVDGQIFKNKDLLSIVRKSEPAVLMRRWNGSENDAPFATLKHVKVDFDKTPYFLMDMASDTYGEFAVKFIDEESGRLYAFRAQQRGLGVFEVNVPALVPALKGKKTLSLKIYYIGRNYRSAEKGKTHHFVYADAGSMLEIRELGFNSKPVLESTKAAETRRAEALKKKAAENKRKM